MSELLARSQGKFDQDLITQTKNTHHVVSFAFVEPLSNSHWPIAVLLAGALVTVAYALLPQYSALPASPILPGEPT